MNQITLWATYGLFGHQFIISNYARGQIRTYHWLRKIRQTTVAAPRAGPFTDLPLHRQPRKAADSARQPILISPKLRLPVSLKERRAERPRPLIQRNVCRTAATAPAHGVTRQALAHRVNVHVVAAPAVCRVTGFVKAPCPSERLWIPFFQRISVVCASPAKPTITMGTYVVQPCLPQAVDSAHCASSGIVSPAGSWEASPGTGPVAVKHGETGVGRADEEGPRRRLESHRREAGATATYGGRCRAADRRGLERALAGAAELPRRLPRPHPRRPDPELALAVDNLRHRSYVPPFMEPGSMTEKA